MKMKFYRCKTCGKVIMILEDTMVPTICCGEAMTELIPSDMDGAYEKHVPVIVQENNKAIVYIGKTYHPMTKEHYIKWIILQTNLGFQKKCLRPGEEPKASFSLVDGEKVECAYEFCNIHLLWKSKD